MGTGTGKGYKNILGNDKSIHSQSARGIKQPQRINPMINLSEKQISNHNQNNLSIIQLENRTAFGTEYLEIRENEFGEIEYRKGWDSIKGKKWNMTKIKATAKNLSDFVKKIPDDYKSKSLWDKIKKEQKKKLELDIPIINKLELIDSKIKNIEGNMVSGRIDSLNIKDQNNYKDLLNKRRFVSQNLQN